MADVNNEELVKKLSESRENINLLFNMLKKEQCDVEHKLWLAGEAKKYLNEVLFDLTGDKFYQNTQGGTQ